MYILTTLEFPKHNHDFHLLTTSVNAKYYYIQMAEIPQEKFFTFLSAVHQPFIYKPSIYKGIRAVTNRYNIKKLSIDSCHNNGL